MSRAPYSLHFRARSRATCPPLVSPPRSAVLLQYKFPTSLLRAVLIEKQGIELGGMIASKRACKPFKAPGSATSTPSLSRVASHARPPATASPRSPARGKSKDDPTGEQAALEKRAHVLRQALDIVGEKKNDAIRALDAKWIKAGRCARSLVSYRRGNDGLRRMAQAGCRGPLGGHQRQGRRPASTEPRKPRTHL
jgi:hypothetical protein